MAFDAKTFRTRTLTSIVFVAVMLAGLLWNQWSFILLFTIIHFGCWYEFVKLMKKINPKKYLYYVLFGLLYITLPVVIMIYVRYTGNVYKGNLDFIEFGKVLPCGIIFSIWINDTMAYIVGSFIGKTPLSKISPKKTWEGTIGGAILCIVTITLVGNATGFYNYHDWIAIAFCCAVFGTIGDLMESKLKRMAQVKDSGTLMPGHGGFLDRFDSLLVAIPFVGLYYFLCM
ncbi:MAG: phosphatidate cytidylyltransferase [Ginsengibacter sp.]